MCRVPECMYKNKNKHFRVKMDAVVCVNQVQSRHNKWE